MDPLVARGAVPLVTVEPWYSSSATDPRFALRNIVRGDFVVDVLALDGYNW
jgi:hypothetical protein